MMLVQKPQQHFSLAQPSLPAAHHHRRHPSAPPAVVVQPTRTPGLLQIKPAKASPHRQLPANQRKDQQHQQNRNAGPKHNKVARAPAALLNPAEITEKRPALAVLQQAPVSPTPTRGRIVPKSGKDSARSKHGRQPSPPIQPSTPPSQAEAPVSSTNPFNPFLDTNAPASIPVPKAQRPKQQPQPKHHQLARSDPTQSHMPKRPSQAAQRNKDRFPICDDMTDAGDSSDAETPPPVTPPATPLRKQAYVDHGARTAPHMKAAGSFPFASAHPASPPSMQQKRGNGRKHRRSPSEGVFAMSLSSDEDVSSNAAGNALLSFARSRAQGKPPATPSPSLSRATAVTFKEQSAGFFASSAFQNSPSPEDLPDPSQFN